MFNARDLLGKLMDSGLGQSIGDRVGHAMGPSGLAASNGSLADLFSQISTSFDQNRGLSDFAGRAEDLAGQAAGAVKSGNPMAIGGLAALAGAVLGGRTGAVKGAVGGGLLALLGSLAYSAFNKAAAGSRRPAVRCRMRRWDCASHSRRTRKRRWKATPP